MLKGTTRIELTDVHTGEVEVIEKPNLVTNAIPDLLQLNPDGYLFDGRYNLSDDLLPICPNAIGGILLYGEPLEEDPAKYYAPESNPLIGYSSNNVNSTTDAKRGSLNLNESGQLDDGTGYRFVFDFGTSQGNGNIASLGLTSKYGGVAGYGSEYNATSTVIKLASKSAKTDAQNTMQYRAIANVVSIDADADIAYFVRVSAVNDIVVGKMRIGKLWLSGTTGPDLSSIVEFKVLTTKTFLPAITDNHAYVAFVDGGDGYIWGFGHANNDKGNSSGVSNILWIKISKADWSFTEGTWSIDKRFHHFGDTYVTNKYDLINYSTYCIIYKGHLYCVDYWKSSIIKINLSNPSDLEYIADPDGETPVPTSVAAACEFNVVGDILYFPGGYFQGGVAYNTASAGASSYVGLWNNLKPGLQIGPYLMGYNVDSSSITRNIYLMTPYLATINNLETPVTKTADKTMKITYILREE